MTDEPPSQPNDDQPDEDGPDDGEPDDSEADSSDVRGFIIDPKLLENLIPFRDLQRTIAGIDFGAVRAAQQAAETFRSVALPDIEAVQAALRAQLADSIDFSSISKLAMQNLQLGAGQELAQQQLAQGIIKSLNLPALVKAQEMFSSLQIPAFADTQRVMAEALSTHYADILKTLGSIDVSQLVEQLDRWLPFNLRGVDALEDVARIALDEGLPLSWVPRTSIVLAIISALSAEERVRLLATHRDDILDDCLDAVSDVPHRWARECEAAVRSMRADLEGPAQSHAANIIDSVVLWVLGKKGRGVAKTRATEEFDDLGLRVAGESLVLRPLNLALTTWWPAWDTPPPEHFARHATAHAVGHPGLFAASHALTAVMLAVSLTVQFWGDPGATAGLTKDPR